MAEGFDKPEERPLSEIRESAKKPLSASGKLSVIAVGVVLTIVIVAIVFSAVGTLKTTKQSASQQSGLMQRPSPTTPDGLSAYDDAQLSQQLAESLRKKQMQEAALTEACQSRNGQITHDANGKAECQLPDDSVPTLTDAQRKEMEQPSGAGTGATGQSGNEAAKTAKERVAASIASDMLTMDLTESKPTAQVPTQPEPPAKQDAATLTASDKPVSQEQSEEDSESEGQDKTATGTKKYDFDQFTGKSYRLFEGTYLETVLKNRLDGEFTGPVQVQLATDLYSHNRQELLIPRGTVLLGTARKVGNNYQRRLAVSFHRMIMPDGFSFDLDKFVGLDQQGSAGLTGKVNHHYIQMFGTSVALGLVSGLSQIGNSTSSLGYSPSVSLRNGMSQQLGQEGEEVLNRFTNVPPTIVISEGARVRVYISQDLMVPAYANHSVSNDL